MTLQQLGPSHQTAINDRIGCVLPRFDYLGPDLVPAWTDPRNIGVLCERCQTEPWDDWDDPDFVAQAFRDGQMVYIKYNRDNSVHGSSSGSSYTTDVSLRGDVNRDSGRV